MAQAINCDTHGEPGIIYLSTLQGTVETITLCTFCMRDFITGWATTLGLIDEWKAELRAELGGELEELDGLRFTGTKKEWDAGIAKARARWLRTTASIDLGDQDDAPPADAVPPAGEALDEQMTGM